MAGLHAADFAVLLVDFVGITLLGIWTAKRVRSMADFVMPRRFGKTFMVSSAGLFWEVSAMLGMAFWLGVFWRGSECGRRARSRKAWSLRNAGSFFLEAVWRYRSLRDRLSPASCSAGWPSVGSSASCG